MTTPEYERLVPLEIAKEVLATDEAAHDFRNETLCTLAAEVIRLSEVEKELEEVRRFNTQYENQLSKLLRQRKEGDEALSIALGYADIEWETEPRSWEAFAGFLFATLTRYREALEGAVRLVDSCSLDTSAMRLGMTLQDIKGNARTALKNK